MTVRRCPHCQTARQDDGRPGCACWADERGTERADAPDFTPLHIRPYVNVSRSADRKGQAAEEPALAGRTREHSAEAPTGGSRAAWQQRNPAMRQAPTPQREPISQQEPVSQQEPTPQQEPEQDVGDTAISDPVRPPKRTSTWRDDDARTDSERRRRRLGTVAGASVAVAAVSAALVGGWVVVQDSFGHSGPKEYRNEPMMSVPTGDARHPSVLPSERDSPTHGGSAQRSPAPSATPSETPAPTPTTGSHPKQPQNPGPRPSPSASPGSGGDQQKPPPDDSPAPRVLAMGDSGPEVVDLQNRLKVVGGLYSDASDGIYDQGLQDAVARFQQWRSIQGDPSGVYGEHTRAELESETGGPS